MRSTASSSSSSSSKRSALALGTDLEEHTPRRVRLHYVQEEDEIDELDDDEGDEEYDELAEDEEDELEVLVEEDRADADVPVASTSNSTRTAFSAYSDKSRQNAARRAASASEDGQAKLAARRVESIAEKKASLKPLIEAMGKDSVAIREEASKISLTDEASSEQLQALQTLCSFLNVVRTGGSSMRYPLTLASDELGRFRDKVRTVATLLQLAQEGKLFDPTQVDQAVLEEEDVEAERREGKGKKEKKGKGKARQTEDEAEAETSEEVLFKFYTRCTIPRSIPELIDQLQQIEESYPIETAWTTTQIAELTTVQANRADEKLQARIFYSGVTIFTCAGREVEDESTQSDYSLLKHWKDVTGDDLQVFHWKELDVRAPSRFAWRTDSTLSGIESVLVDACGGPAMTLNQHPGGFVERIKPHHLLLPIYPKLQQLREEPKPLPELVTTPAPDSKTIQPRKARAKQIKRMLESLVKFVKKYPRTFKKPIAEEDFLDSVVRMASGFKLVGDNVARATIMKDQPEEALTVPNKMFDDAEAGRAPRSDMLLDQEMQGIVSFLTGQCQGMYKDKRFPMLDLWCVTIDHPDGWIIIQIIVLVIWVHVLKPRYVIIGAAKLFNLCIQGRFSDIFIQDEDTLSRLLSEAFATQGFRFTDFFLGSILQDPRMAPSAEPVDATQLLSVLVILIWEELTLNDYIDYVGTIRVVKMGVRWVVTVPVYHGGSHAYIGVLRPFTMQLAQACRMMVELLDIVTRKLDVDGSKEQAEAIAKAVMDAAKITGVSAAVEKIRADVRTVFKAWQSLKMLGAVKRQDDDARAKQHVHFSEVMSRTVQAEDEKSLKAVGAPGSTERVEQALGILQANRELINDKNHVGIEPCPSQIAEGPGSVQALLWMIFCVAEGAAYGRTARGATRLPADEGAQSVAFAELQVKRLSEARSRFAQQESGVITSAEEALAYTSAKSNNCVRLVTCYHCDWVGIVKREKGFEDRLRHVCPNKTGNLVDLDKMADNVAALKRDISSSQKGKQSEVTAAGNLSMPQRLKAWSSDGRGGKWADCKSDSIVEAVCSGIKDGSINSSGQKKGKSATSNDRSVEKHGRLVFAEMKVPDRRLYAAQLTAYLEEKHDAQLPVPALPCS